MLVPKPQPEVLSDDECVKLKSGRMAIVSVACQRTPMADGYPMLMPALPPSCAPAMPLAASRNPPVKVASRPIRMRKPPCGCVTTACERVFRRWFLLDDVPEHQFADRRIHLPAAQPRAILRRGRVGVHREEVRRAGWTVEIEVRDEAVLIAAVADELDAAMPLHEEGERGV